MATGSEMLSELCHVVPTCMTENPVITRNEVTMSSEETKPTQEITIVGVESGKVRASKRELVERTIDVEQVRESFNRFLAGLKVLISDSVPSMGNYELDEIEFKAEVSANGEFKLLGSGVGLEATTGVSFKMKRKALVSNQQ
jgi:hypothetical protein